MALLRSQFVGRRKKYIYIYIDVEEIKMARKENREIELEGGGGGMERVYIQGVENNHMIRILFIRRETEPEKRGKMLRVGRN